ncbi:MAG TPA: translation initiation factor IF-2, partial [Bacilli bacterium]
IMGHVDHGKTTLLDTIRNSRVALGEAGGITQHIGAYQVNKNNKLITFIDTPGHAAFTEMRSRGAEITDIVVLVVAADDGVMPQTIEAIEHAKAAKVPIIVAVNKMDKPSANPERIKQELANYGLLSEDWGGDTIFVPISALKNQGVDELLDMILLVAEMQDLKANPNRLGIGTVLEAKLDKGRGVVATLLVKNGSIKVGDPIVVGNTYGKVRAMTDENRTDIQVALPSKAVEVMGITEVPNAGDPFMVFEDEKTARLIAEHRALRAHEQELGGRSVTLANIFEDKEGEKDLKLIIKGDVQGSIEALKNSLSKLEVEGVKVDIVRSAVGTVTETDISLAIAANAIIIGFNIRPQSKILEYAKEKGVEVRLYNIIYKLLEDIEAAMKGMLDPVYEEAVIGEAEVRQTFKVSKVGTIAGCYVTNGVITRNSQVRLIRDSIVIYTGNISTLKRFKDDVREVKAGYECGLTIENYNDIKEGDVIEAFVMKKVE